MKSRSYSRAAAGLAAVLLLAAGCGSDPAERAIRRLAGPPAEARRGAMELRLMSGNPVEALVRVIENPREKQRVRLRALEVLASIAQVQKDKTAYAVLLKTLDQEDPELRLAAAEGFLGSDYEPAIPPLVRLKSVTTDPEDREQVNRVLESLAASMAERIEALWMIPQTAMEAYEKAEAMGVNRGALGYSKARFLENRGRLEEAETLYRDLGLIRAYWIIGTFANRQGTGFHQHYPPEKEIDLKATYEIGDEILRWYRIDRPLFHGRLDFERYFVEIDQVAAYALVFVHSDRAQPAEIRSGSNDSVKIFLNGEEVYTRNESRRAIFDDDRTRIDLEKGVNTLMFKVGEYWGTWELIARITGPGDVPLEGVTISTKPDLFASDD